MLPSKDYPFQYDLHVHTSQGSLCGRSTGAEIAKAYKDAGYAGIVITDHHFGGNTRPDRNLPWEEWAEAFCSGYWDAKQTGDAIGLQVFFGWESGFHGTEFLIVGLTPEWMKQHPELRDCSIQEQYQLVHESGGLVIHAHPFRRRPYIRDVRLYPDYIDAVERINASHSNPAVADKPEYDDEAAAFAKKYHKPVTAGSDQHDSVNLRGAGICFKRKMQSAKDLVQAIKNREDSILTDGAVFYPGNRPETIEK